MKLCYSEIMQKIEVAKKFQLSGKLKEAEKVYVDSLRNNENSFDIEPLNGIVQCI